MAKKQVFGSEALQAKAAQRKLAKVVISTKNEKGTFSYSETMVDQDSVKEFIAKNKS